MKFEESISAISHAFRLKSGEKASIELENLSSASVSSTSDYDRRKLYKPTSDWACFSLKYRNLACSTRYLFTTMFLIDNSKKEEDVEYCEVSFRNSYFGRSEQSDRVDTVCINWRYNCKELARKGWKGLYVLLLCENNTNRTISLMWTAAVLVYFFYPRYGVELSQDNSNIAAIAFSLMQQYCTHEDLRKRFTFFFTNYKLF